MLGVRAGVCIFVVSYCCFVLLAVAETTSPSEVTALRAVKKRLIDPMKNIRNWGKGDPCTSKWKGIVCKDKNTTDGYLHVNALLLLKMNLSGTLAPELGQLSHLEIIDFLWNDLSGSIPKEIGNIAPLRLLLLSGNRLSGSLPDELGYLSHLDRLQIDENQISGLVPKSFANLSRIKHLHMNNNSLSGRIPSELSNASTLRHLLFDNNNLSGNLPPELSHLPELRILQLDNNNFSGAEIPISYGNLSNLVKLSLRNCSLQGAVPDFSKIANLSYLDLSLNQLTGPIPSNKLSDNMTTIDLSGNHLNGSIQESFSDLPRLQKLLLENNLLSGSVPTGIWQNRSLSTSARLTVDLQNNSFSNITGDLNPPANVTLWLQGNPICSNANIVNIHLFCGSESGGKENPESSTNSTDNCRIQECLTDDFFEYVPASPIPCFCASPLRVGYRLKSPSFSYFIPYESPFEKYVTSVLNMELYQLHIDSFFWEEGPRLRMHFKLFPTYNNHTFNTSEVLRIRGIFASWDFPSNDFFGPYELLSFPLLGPYSGIDSATHGTSLSMGIWVAILLGATACAIAISITVTLLIVRRHSKYQNTVSRRRLSSTISMKIDGVRDFTYREMALATDNFNDSTQVGQGGYGRVYKGILYDNTVVAIKRAQEGSLQGQKEFLTEIQLLSRLHHRNLVSLIGYCAEEGEQMLVYEFMPNGTLRDWLSAKSKTLIFSTRLRIALGSAKGILYLHTEAQPPIFHRDIKASNILLDSKFTPKVADFGLSRLAPDLEDEGAVPNHVSTIVKGTPGYLDPEYFLTRKLTDKSDVYSLGVVFLEILTGMQPISHGKNIVREVNMSHQLGMVFSIIDNKMGSYPSECVERFLALALRCCHDKPEDRPSMLDVVRELENILRMMPEIETQSSESASHSGKLLSLPSSSYVSRDLYSISNASGSDLVSGVIPTIAPR